MLLTEIADDADLGRQWNELLVMVDRPQVFYTYEWSLAVQRAYRATLRPLVYLAYDEQKSLLGVAALAIDDRSEVSFLCASTGDYCDFLSLPEHKTVFVEMVLGDLRKQGIENISFTNLPADSLTAVAIRRASSNFGYHRHARRAYVCTQVRLDELERRPDGKLVLPRKKMVRRFLNAMGREAPVRLDHARSWDELRPALPGFMQAHIARFLVTGRISNMARAERRIFLEELAKLLSGSGWIVLTRMMSSDKAFAWNYGFQFRDTWFWYQPTFESDLAKYSPGFCLLAKLIEEAAATPELTTVDLGLGAEEYKDRIANRTRETLYITLKTSAAQHCREIGRYTMGRILRLSPRVEKPARAAREIWNGFRKNRMSAGSVLRRMGHGLQDICWLQTEVFFHEWQGRGGTVLEPNLDVRGLNLFDLASATCQYVDDQSTLNYLLRCARRLDAGTTEAYGLVDTSGRFLHFACASNFNGFLIPELNATIDPPADNCVILFDCWTPIAARDRGYHAQALERIAKLLHRKEKRAWTYSIADNPSPFEGFQESSFVRRYSLTRQRIFGWQRIKGRTPKLSSASTQEVSAQV